MARRFVFVVGVLLLFLVVGWLRRGESPRTVEPMMNRSAPASRVDFASRPIEDPRRRLRPEDPAASSRIALFTEQASEPEPEEPLETGLLLVRLLPVGPLPEIDLQGEVAVELWDFEPRHLRDATRDPWDDPSSLDLYGDEVEAGILFEEVPPDRRLWASASGVYFESETEGFLPVIVPVPPPPSGDEEWSVVLRVASVGWVHGRVVDVGEDTYWELLCEETGEQVHAWGADAFRFWPVPAGPITLTMTVEEDGRFARRRHSLVARSSGGIDLGELPLPVRGEGLGGIVRLEDGSRVSAGLLLSGERGAPVSLETDAQGSFLIEGDLLGLTTLRVQPEDLHAFEPVTIDLSWPRSRTLEVVLPRRPERLLDVVVSPRLSNGEYVEGELAMILGSERDSAAQFAANHRGWCGAGIFTLHLVPPGELRYAAWIPEKGLCGTGRLTVVPPGPESDAAGLSFDGRPYVHPVLREADTLVSGELVALPGANPPSMRAGVEPFVRLHGDSRTLVRLDWIDPGRFTLRGLPAGCDFRLELRNQREQVLRVFDLRLDWHEHLELGEVVVGGR